MKLTETNELHELKNQDQQSQQKRQSHVTVQFSYRIFLQLEPLCCHAHPQSSMNRYALSWRWKSLLESLHKHRCSQRYWLYLDPGKRGGSHEEQSCV